MEKFIEFPLSNKCIALTTTTELGNMAYQVDEGKGVKERREELAELLSIDLNRFVFVHQHHSDEIQKVTKADMGKGMNRFEDGVDVDALYTYEKNVPLCIFHADCVPIFFVDEKKALVGIIHAGYKGTLKHITSKAIQKVIKDENLKISNLKFYIGPYRLLGSFPVNEESKKEIKEAGLEEAIINNHFDNGYANVLDLLKIGVQSYQIKTELLDTVRDERLYSAYQKTPVGRLMSLIYLK